MCEAPQFEARLTDSNGEPIQDAGLTFEFAGAESLRDFTSTTDEEGVASVTPSLEEMPSPYQLTARFAGEGDFYLGSSDDRAGKGSGGSKNGNDGGNGAGREMGRAYAGSVFFI